MREYSSCDILGKTGIEILKNSRNASVLKAGAQEIRRGLTYYKILKDRSCEVRRNNKIIKFLRQTYPIKEEDIQELINIIQEIEW